MHQPFYRVVGIGFDGLRTVVSQGISLRRARHVRALLRWDKVFDDIRIEREQDPASTDPPPSLLTR